MSADRASASDTSANGPVDLAEQATEGLLGPNPFVGLRVEDIVTSFRAIGEQAILNPMLVIEQEAALIMKRRPGFEFLSQKERDEINKNAQDLQLDRAMDQLRGILIYMHRPAGNEKLAGKPEKVAAAAVSPK